MYLDAKREVVAGLSTIGPLSVAVRGTPAGLLLALEKYGTLDRRRVLAPAIQLAAEGFPVSYRLAEYLKKKSASPGLPTTLPLPFTLAEVMKRAYADRAEFMGDADFTPIPVRGLTSKPYTLKRRQGIDPDRATPSKELGAGDPLPFESEETTHFTVVDAPRVRHQWIPDKIAFEKGQWIRLHPGRAPGTCRRAPSSPSCVARIPVSSKPWLATSHVLRIASRRPTVPGIVLAIASHDRWIIIRQVREALAMNPFTPTAVAVVQLPILVPQCSTISARGSASIRSSPRRPFGSWLWHGRTVNGAEASIWPPAKLRGVGGTHHQDWRESARKARARNQAMVRKSGGARILRRRSASGPSSSQSRRVRGIEAAA
jgi:hypothetical protein